MVRKRLNAIPIGFAVLVVIGAVAGDAVAAEHSVLGEFFTQPL